MKHFCIEEFIDIETYRKFGSKSIWFVDQNLINVMDRLRENLGQPITINDWKWGGNFQWRGLRTIDCDIGANYSLHRLGKACDFNVRNMSADEVRKHIISNVDEYNEIKGLELGTSWVHIDLRNSAGLIMFGGKIEL